MLMMFIHMMSGDKFEADPQMLSDAETSAEFEAKFHRT